MRIFCAIVLMALLLTGCETVAVPNSFALFTYGDLRSPAEILKEKRDKQAAQQGKVAELGEISVRNLQEENK